MSGFAGVVAASNVTSSGGNPFNGTWNPARKGSDITLSGANLIASKGNSGAYQSVFGTGSVSSGLAKFAETMTNSDGFYPGIGVGNSSALTTDYAGQTTNSIGFYGSGDVYYNATVLTNLGVTYISADVIECNVDRSSNTIYWKKNGVIVGSTQVLSVSGAVSPMATLYAVSNVVTGNFT